MKNTVIISTNPINSNGHKHQTLEKQLRLQILEQNLELARSSFLRMLEYDIPVIFTETIHLHLSGNINTMQVNVDYSGIKVIVIEN